MSNRFLLLSSYVILVLITAWDAFNINRAIENVREDVCVAAEIGVANELFTLSVFGRQEGVDAELFDQAIGVYVELARGLQDHCGVTFLDEIDITPRGG